MIDMLAILLLAAQASPAPVAAPPATAPTEPARPPLMVPTDWASMPPLPWRVVPVPGQELAEFVAREVREGRCTATRPALEVELAMYVRADGVVRAVVPRAIDCPTVEQFAAGLASSFARGNLRTPAAGWYRTAITFDWDR